MFLGIVPLIVGDIKRLISNRITIWIISLGICSRLIAITLIPEKLSTQISLDQFTYANLARWVANSIPVEFYPGYGPGLYNSTRTFTIPSSLLVRLGIDPIDSVRLVSAIYGAFTIIAFSLLLLRVARLSLNKQMLLPNRLFNLVLFSFSFFPSNFLWSVVGLKESSSQFWIMLALYFLILESDLRKTSHRNVVGLAALLSLVLAFGTRKETAILICAILIVSYTLSILKRHTLRPVWVPMFAIILGSFYTATPQVSASSEFILTPNNLPITAQSDLSVVTSMVKKQPQGSKPSPAEGNPSPAEGNPSPSEGNPSPSEESSSVSNDLKNLAKLCSSIGQKIDLGDQSYVCSTEVESESKSSDAVSAISGSLNTISRSSVIRENNRFNADSAIPENACKLKDTYGLPIRTLCNASQLFTSLPQVLFSPSILGEHASIISRFAAVENIFWMVLIFLVSFSFVGMVKRRQLATLSLSLLMFTFSVVVLLALLEGNLGTAFRHKSTVLWSIFLIIYIYIQENNLYSNWTLWRMSKKKDSN